MCDTAMLLHGNRSNWPMNYELGEGRSAFKCEINKNFGN